MTPTEDASARHKLTFEDNGTLAQLVGPGGRNLKTIERTLGLRIHARGNEMTLVGGEAAVDAARALLEQLYEMTRRGRPLAGADLARAARMVGDDPTASVRHVYGDTLLATPAGAIAPKGPAQKRYVDAIRAHDIVFGIGPAGTGKTYLAMAMAVTALKDHEVKRIILTRPAVEAGEKLGFLPGDLVEKVNPYLRPLYDALHDMMSLEKAQRLINRGVIEVAPLAFMRGRTLNGSFVIFDEAQNATSDQMLMFLTRLGFDSKAVVTGDVTQVDLPAGARSGLSEARRVLDGIEGIGFVTFSEKDVVRHPLVQKIITAYERRRQGGRDAGEGGAGEGGAGVPDAGGAAAPDGAGGT